ncbi:glutamine--fructose-6-phosphate transaminase (isomerizing) [Kineosporia sp. J2-2]|uniref:Glutamine--fructose-6-phosphate aminotransferase [isomerizing] n=1 Tax=Kineosporia corallincola TaxID=2835133 RepID=A0ABS5TI68_9ACTN|nr:glutamine--fructose-6-phosphate transaminase (isomerizing) [Kineosporia corallincola]MBT0770781.1 glutamine--fructose-6-phosphate transaminase (isomerizing) [Kineosporia corallincola]
MCGIVAYIGDQQAAPIILDGLTRLEYRGYDSAGIAVSEKKTVRVARAVGRVRHLRQALPKKFTGTSGIGHTRWATHGPATEENAHPHSSADGRISLVHNGIIDNAAELKAELVAAGVPFTSATDTEVVAHLIAAVTAPTLEQAVLEVTKKLEGTYGLAVLDTEHPDRIVLARSGSPLIIGVGKNGTHVASDIAALTPHTTSVVHLEDGELATVTASGFTTFTHDQSDTSRPPTEVPAESAHQELGEFAHHMRKEYWEQPASAARALKGRLEERFGTARLDGLNLDARAKRAIRRVKILGCGSSYYVGQMGAQMIEELARIPADAEPASEFRYRNPIIDPETLYVAVSQSGETADTLFAIDEIKRKGGQVVGLVNVVGSSIARACDGGIYLHAGPEVAVASTKALTNMALSFGLLALDLGRIRDLSIADAKRIIDGLQAIPGQIDEILRQEDRIAEVAKPLSASASLFFVGRVRGFPVAREGAQKFKEVSYCHAEAYQSSELKHGPLALISAQLPTVAIVPDDELVQRNVGALHEIAARGGPLVAITHAGVDLSGLTAERIDVPKNEVELDPILLTIPTQLLAYHAALALGHDIDKPRNLAKSVTVE